MAVVIEFVKEKNREAIEDEEEKEEDDALKFWKVPKRAVNTRTSLTVRLKRELWCW